jgi:recombination protein RecA
MFGSPEVTTGGNALKFYASVRLDIRRSLTTDNSVYSAENKEQKIGNLTKVKVIKNKVAPPFREASFDVLFGVGIDKVGEVIEEAKDADLLRLRAGVVTYEDTKYPEAEFRQMLVDNQEFYQALRTKILNPEVAV